MSKNMERIFFAFLLSFVGAIVAKQFEALWWIGLIFGFISGYIGYDIRSFLGAIPVALASSCAEVGTFIPTTGRLKRFACCAFYTFGAGVCTGLICFGAISLLIFPLTHVSECLLMASYGGFFMGIFLVWMTPSDSKTDAGTQMHIEDMSTIIRWMHPIPFAIRTLPLGIFYSLRVVAWITEKGSELGWRFLYHLYRLVHSHERVLFGLDVALGVAIGHYSGNALLGGFAGAAWWILDWHVISVKLMRAQPAQ